MNPFFPWLASFHDSPLIWQYIILYFLYRIFSSYHPWHTQNASMYPVGIIKYGFALASYSLLYYQTTFTRYFTKLPYIPIFCYPSARKRDPHNFQFFIYLFPVIGHPSSKKKKDMQKILCGGILYFFPKREKRYLFLCSCVS